MPASVITPSAEAIASLPPAPVLTPDELHELETVKLHFGNVMLELPEDGKHGASTGLSEGERYWLSRECLLRYLKSTKGDAKEAISRITSTLLWRREIGVDQITAEEIESEGACGKAFLLGYSTRAEPLLYITPSRRDTEPSEKQFRHVVWLLERCCDLMGPGIDGAIVLLNFAGKSKRPSVTFSTRVLSMMTHHYPQRVAGAFIQNTPLVLSAFLSVVWPFIDPATRDKVDTKGRVGPRVDPAVLIKDWHGELDYDYTHATYWPYLRQLAGAKRSAAFNRWLLAGEQVGASERELRRWDDGVGAARQAGLHEGDFKHAGTGVETVELPILV